MISYIQKLRQYLFDKQLKQLAQRKVLRHTPSFQKAKHLGLLFDASKKSSTEAILQYANQLESKGKKVELLGFIPTKNIENEPPYPFFTLKDVAFNFTNKKESVQDFCKQPFDLLIAFFQNDIFPLEYVCVASHATCRVGQHQEKLHCFDLIIPTNTQNDFTFFVRQMEKILSKMN